MSEGIYRRSGSSSAVVKLLEAFRRDAWATQITRNSYTEHDVATVLRRFIRDLPDPLFPAKIHDRLCLTAGSKRDLFRTYIFAMKIAPTYQLTECFHFQTNIIVCEKNYY